MIIEEVHLWRGSPEQQSLRSQLVKSTQFAYFDAQLDHPQWPGRRVLDFGGNRGGLLQDPACTIRHEDYYCLDVIREAIEEGRRAFPQANWFHYDRYNCSFNPDGVEAHAIPDLGVQFDLILAYSVFTHTTFEEMKDLVEQLRARLAPGGRVAFTFIDPHWESNLRWRLEKRNPPEQVAALIAQSRDARWCALVNGTELFLNGNGAWRQTSEECITYNIYYTEDFMQEQFPYATIKRPMNGEMQHCCIIGATD